MSYLAVPICGSDVATCSVQIAKAAVCGAEMLELRVDYLKGLNATMLKEVVIIARAASLPLIVTCRDSAEGGMNEYPQQFRCEILAEAVCLGVDYIDCEYKNYCMDQVEGNLSAALQGKKTRLILSVHDFGGAFFGGLDKLYEDILEVCPDAIAKLVYTARHINDCFAAFDLLSRKKGDAIVLCMGAAGEITRILAKKFGGFLTFASIDETSATAPGQITAKKLKDVYRWDAMNEQTEVYGVIGSPVAHSISPAIFNTCFAAAGMNKVYVPCLVDGERKEFAEFINNVSRLSSGGGVGFGGFSVTIPHKAHAMDHVRELGEHLEQLANDIGAANTLKIGFGGIVSGYNTDYAGALNALVAAMGISKHQLHKVRVAILGAGGASRAIIAGLADVGADVTIYNRTVEKAKSLAKEFRCKWSGLDGLSQMETEVVVNCTSIGMDPNVDESPLPRECLKEGMTVFDMVYNPLETLLLTRAKAAGARTVTGAEMFVRQAMKQFKIFTGQAGDEELMRKTVFDCLS